MVFVLFLVFVDFTRGEVVFVFVFKFYLGFFSVYWICPGLIILCSWQDSKTESLSAARWKESDSNRKPVELGTLFAVYNAVKIVWAVITE